MRLFSTTLITIYGLLVLFGGIMGYYKVASLMSLIMGVAFGVLLLLSAYGIYKKALWGIYGSFLLTFCLTIFFAYRYLVKTHTLWPAGIMALVSALVLILLRKPREGMTHK